MAMISIQAGDLRYILKNLPQSIANQAANENNSKDPVTLNLKSASVSKDLKGAMNFSVGGGTLGVAISRKPKITYQKKW